MLRENQTKALRVDQQVENAPEPHGPKVKLLDKKLVIDFPVYFAERSRFYELFDQITVEIKKLNADFEPSDEQRYFTVENLVMGNDLDCLKVKFVFNLNFNFLI